MNPALLLIDLQNDFLAAEGLQPAAPEICSRAAVLLEGFRTRGWPVIHVRLTVRRDLDNRMPHWKQAGKWACEEGTAGHESPAPLQALAGETIIHKQFFDGFESGELERFLREINCKSLVMSGLHLHGCVKTTALEAYRRGFETIIAEDAVGSDDPLHAAITRRYLAARAATFEPVTALLSRLDKRSPASRGTSLIHRSPRDDGAEVVESPNRGRREVADAVAATRQAWVKWRATSTGERAQLLLRFADRIAGSEAMLAKRMAVEIGKPVTQAAAEVRRSAAMLRSVAARATEPLEFRTTSEARYRLQPIGVTGIMTPWNNPLAIPVGKIAPALLYGNAALWKPAPAGTGIARDALRLLAEAGSPEGLVSLITGDQTASQFVAEDRGVDAVTLSGSPAAGFSLQEICARRSIPFQAELGGNNAAIVWDDADPADAAQRIAEGLFCFAGQRCTANRRVIVSATYFEHFLRQLEEAVGNLVWGDPLEPGTQIGPLISAGKAAQVSALVARAASGAERIISPFASRRAPGSGGAWHPPVIVVSPTAGSEIIHEETFGPVMVVQRADGFEHALALCNEVRQGLAAALFSASPVLQEQFLREAAAGILKLNRATADADTETPFGGWKASGIGPAEHGAADREFFTRMQAIYEAPRAAR